MRPILAFPALAGMSYPRLEEGRLIRTVADFDDLASMPENERRSVRVLMTSASRGCSATIVDPLPNLKFVISQGAGTDLLDLKGLEHKGIRVRSVGEALTDDVADLAMALTHMLCRDLLGADAFARSGAWRTARFEVRDSLVDMTMGIAGLSGRIGRAIAARATVSRMRIAGLKRPSNENLGATLYSDWVELAAASDVLVLAVPGNRDLSRVIGARELRALGPKGRLVNVGRGNLVDTQALIEALASGAIAGAALDVIDTEPSVPDRLAAFPNVVLTPHIGGQTWGQRARGAKIAEDEILAFLGEAESHPGSAPSHQAARS